MCGVAGELSFDGPADIALVDRMADAMAPRGPDGSGGWAHGRVALAHRRLRIIDLSERGAQPMVDPELGLAVVFNGCIYNHRELRAELEAAGLRFFSDNDTEVVLKSCSHWGEGCVERFKGMFAFAVAERDSGRLVLARDRLGVKPLYGTRPSRATERGPAGRPRTGRTRCSRRCASRSIAAWWPTSPSASCSQAAWTRA